MFAPAFPAPGVLALRDCLPLLTCTGLFIGCFRAFMEFAERLVGPSASVEPFTRFEVEVMYMHAKCPKSKGHKNVEHVRIQC